MNFNGAQIGMAVVGLFSLILLPLNDAVLFLIISNFFQIVFGLSSMLILHINKQEKIKEESEPGDLVIKSWQKLVDSGQIKFGYCNKCYKDNKNEIRTR